MASDEPRKSKYFLKQEAKRLKEEERRRKSLEQSEARLQRELRKDDKKKQKKGTHNKGKNITKPVKNQGKTNQSKDRKEKDRKEKDRKEKDRKEKDRKEKDRKEKDRKSKDRKEKDRKEKDRKEKDRKSKDRKEKDRKEKALEKTVETTIVHQPRGKKHKKKRKKPSPLSTKPPHKPKTQVIKKSLKPESMISGFTFATILKNANINFADTIKAKFIIANNGYLQNADKILYKIYLLDSNRKAYLLKIGLKSFKRTLKLSISIKFSKIIPPTPFFNFRIELFSNRKLIAHYDGEEIKISDKKAEKSIKIQSVDITSNVIIPKNPLIFWLKYTYKPIPRTRTVEIQAALSIKNLNLEENSYEIELGDASQKGQSPQLIPFSFPIPEFSGDNEKLKFAVSIMDVESQKTLYSKTLLIIGKSSLLGLKYDHIGYKRNIKVGETAYMVADLINKTPYKVKGKARFTFHTVSSEIINCFNRKFSIRPNNYDKISEDVTLTEDLAGKKMWVIVRSKFKTKRGKVFLEGISKQIDPKINNSPSFTATIRAAIHADNVYFNDIIPIGIDTRIRTRDKLKRIYCEVVQNFENIDIKPIYKFKIKDLESYHSNFHWKVPAKYGKCSIDVRFYVNGLRVVTENINKSPLSFDLYPKPK